MITINSAEILCVGTELLLGDIVNTDAAYLSRKLAALGINQYYQGVVGDNPARLEGALRLALSRSDLVILTGGLGPTYDDLTKETAAKLMGRKMFMHEESLERMMARMNRYGAPITENNKKQALMPEGAVVFKNDYGTAPGLAIEDEEQGKIIILLPGPPRELEPMFAEQVEPYLKKFSDHVLLSKTVNIFGMGESRVESILRDMMLESKNPTIAPYAKDGEVQLRVTAAGKSEDECAAICDEAIEKIRETEVGSVIYGVDAGSLEEALVRELCRQKKTAACAESCTGGYVAKRITNVSGASEILEGSIVTYANRVKEKFVDVSHETLEAHGAVSRETAIEMARGVRKLFDAHVGISTTGIAGPNGGTPDKPVGTVFVAVSTEDREEIRELHIGNGLQTREYVRYVSASNALDLARRIISGQ
ncbi:MAG: competence/damage-inducible protein A [Ruminococcaceae bacterium]|nr:competence/damage-inducible protein A [Oscillospiraceae bacterium]